LLLAEVATRALSDEGPAWTFRDPVVGRRFTRSWEGKAHVEEAGRAVHLAFNSEGLRDKEWSRARGPNVYPRVAVLGDSMVAALATDVASRFTELLVRHPRRWDGQDDPNHTSVHEHEVQNWGVAGSSPGFAVRLYEERVRRYAPDAVVLCWFAGNDLADDWAPLGGRRQTAFDLDPTGALVRREFDDGPGALSEWLARNSRFYVWQRRLLARVREGGAAPALRPGLKAFTDPALGEVARAWALQDALLKAFAKAVRADGALPLLVLLPCAEQVYDDHFESVRQQAQAEGLVLAREHVGARLARAAEAAGLPFLDLTGDFRRAAPASSLAKADEHLFLGGTGHLNDAGHRVVAAALARALPQAGEPGR
jgi:hypothetical protein